MSWEEEQIDSLRETLKKALNAPRYKDGSVYDRELHKKLQDALIDVGKEEIYELKDEIYPYLNDPCEEYRDEATRTLGSYNRLQLPEFRDRAFQIWLNDPSEDVRTQALNAWAGYYRGQMDPIVLNYLYNVLKSESYPIEARVYALYGFVHVAEGTLDSAEKLSILELDESPDQKALTRAMDWGKINRIMQEYVRTPKSKEQVEKIKKLRAEKPVKRELKRSTKVEDLRKVLIEGKECSRGVSGYPLDAELGWELYLTLIDVRIKALQPLKEEVYPYLYDPYKEYRILAVQILGSNIALHLEEFKDQAYQIFKDDESEDVKFTALEVWLDYYKNSCDSRVLMQLYNILTGPYREDIRAMALHGIFYVTNTFISYIESTKVRDIGEMKEYGNHIKAIDPKRIDKIMEQYVSEWQS